VVPAPEGYVETLKRTLLYYIEFGGRGKPPHHRVNVPSPGGKNRGLKEDMVIVHSVK
jgi:hypothetical protein